MSNRNPILLAVVATWLGQSIALADWRDDIGYTALQSQLGAGTPTGAGVPVGQIEANEGANPAVEYLPDTTSGEFIGKTFSDISATNTAPSSHASTVANFFYGNTQSIAPGVTSISGFEALDYLNNVLEYASGGIPDIQTTKVQSNAYVATTGVDSADANILGRLDFSIDRDDFIAVAGMNNGSGGTRAILGFAFNNIAVGVTDGSHVAGPTSTVGYGTGRAKPDLVAPGTPGNRTSWATAQTASAVALLHEAGAGTDAVRSETIKAILMAGATKDDIITPDPWTHTPTAPLDPIHGAGELNVQNSYWIINAGQQEGTTGSPPAIPVGADGWDYEATIAPAIPRHYDIEIPAGKTASELSVMLNWNANITSLNGQGTPTFTFANMDLRIYDSTTAFKGTLLDSSISTDHNLEHLYLTNLASGTYTVEVMSDTLRDFGLAWRTVIIPEPTTGLLLLFSTFTILVARRRR